MMYVVVFYARVSRLTFLNKAYIANFTSVLNTLAFSDSGSGFGFSWNAVVFEPYVPKKLPISNFERKKKYLKDFKKYPNFGK